MRGAETEPISDEESDTVPWRWMIGITAVAILLRIAVALVVSDGYVPVNDAVDFDRNATSLAEVGEWPESILPSVDGPTAFRSPAYPLALAALYTVTGPSMTAGLVLNGVLGGLVVLVLGALATRVCGRTVGLVAAVVACGHPTMILFGSSLQLEPLLLVCGYGALWCAVEHRRSAKTGWLVACGVLCGLAVLSRESAAVFGIVSVIIIGLGARGRDPRPIAILRPLAAVAAIALVTLVPWFARNQAAFGEQVAVSTSPQIALLGTYNQESRDAGSGAWIYLSEDLVEITDALGHEGEAAVSTEAGRRARDFALDNPSYIPSVVKWNFIRLFDLRGFEDAVLFARVTSYPTSLARLSVIASYLTEAITLVALVSGAARRVPKYFWLIPIITTIGVVFVFGMMRYRAAFEPFVIMVAACQLAVWSERARRQFAGRSTTA